MLWSPIGATVNAGTSATQFRSATMAGGVARAVNLGAAPATFSLGGSAVTDTFLIPLGIGQEIYIAFGPSDTHIIASVADHIRITPGAGRP